MDDRMFELWAMITRQINRGPARLFWEEAVSRVRLVYDTEGEKSLEVHFADGRVERLETKREASCSGARSESWMSRPRRPMVSSEGQDGNWIPRKLGGDRGFDSRRGHAIFSILSSRGHTSSAPHPWFPVKLLPVQFGFYPYLNGAQSRGKLKPLDIDF